MADTKDLTVFNQNLIQVYARLRKGLNLKPRGYEWRIAQLTALKRMLDENDAAISEAMWKDLRKSPFECQATEQGVVLAELNFTLKHLKKWMRVRKAQTPLYNLPGRCRIVYEPYGLALIIGAWNYPINLTLAPLVAAIAGGNAALIKPSEMSVNTAAILAELIPRYLDPDLFAVVCGGADETGAVLDQKFDTIFFTGSGPVGKIILAKAAPNLTPVTLELGGKSPALVLEDADLEVTARRLAWGKFMNAGQTCVAPDYILCVPKMKAPLVAALKKCLAEFYGADVKASPDYCRIINAKNFDRLAKLMQGSQVLHGGQTNRDELFIEPTLLDSTIEAPVMQDEIFGPLLPIVEMPNLESMIAFVNSRPKPLALYLFTKNSVAVEAVTDRTSSGSLAVNDVVIHMPIPDLPFGGVGASGMGNYHGEYGFKTFTHAKGILHKSFWFDVPVRYAPYTPRKAKLLRWLFS